jgi:hypothetical protein
MRDMYWNQHRFEKREGKHPRYFLRRPGFVEAYEYLRFSSEATGERGELRAWWREFIKTNPLAPTEAREVQETREKRFKPARKRRRGRGGKNRSAAPKPKA